MKYIRFTTEEKNSELYQILVVVVVVVQKKIEFVFC